MVNSYKVSVTHELHPNKTIQNETTQFQRIVFLKHDTKLTFVYNGSEKKKKKNSVMLVYSLLDIVSRLLFLVAFNPKYTLAIHILLQSACCPRDIILSSDVSLGFRAHLLCAADCVQQCRCEVNVETEQVHQVVLCMSTVIHS